MKIDEFKVGHRYLINYRYPISTVLYEVKVLEITKKNFIKLELLNSHSIEWNEINNLELLEDLGLCKEVENKNELTRW